MTRTSFPGRPRKSGPREPSGRPQRTRDAMTIPPTPELIAQRKRAGTDEGTSMDHPLDVMHSRGELLLPAERGDSEARLIGQRRRDAGAMFANLSWHVFGQPFAGIDHRTRRFVPPSDTAEDADQRRARQTDMRTPEERAEDVRCRYEAVRALLRAGSVREWVVRQVAVYCRPIASLARSRSKREAYRVLLVEGLDIVGDMKAVKRSEDGVRVVWAGRRAAA